MTGHRAAVTFVGGRYPHRPTCSCGWATWGYLSAEAAQNVADDHEVRQMIAKSGLGLAIILASEWRSGA